MNFKKALLISAIGAFLALMLFIGTFSDLLKNKNGVLNEQTLSLQTVSETTIESNFKEVSVNDLNYVYAIEHVSKPENVYLIDNFDNKLSSNEALNRYGCKILFNGGFHNEVFKPIGFFKNESGVYSNIENNQLLNGLVSISIYDTPLITSLDYDINKLKLSVQSGPLLIVNSLDSGMNLNNQTKARRSVAFTDGQNRLYFLVILDRNNRFSGPTLSALTPILREIEVMENLKIADAINLDGGSSTLLIKEGFRINETSRAGSFFCVK